MAVSFVARKCTQCAGKLEYIKETKTWRCLYCGAEIEREERYDGLFTIKNVVRQALVDTAYRRLENAEDNIVECEKIDARYVGTLIAKIAYEMICVITPGACTPNEARNLFSQLKKNYARLQEVSPTISEEEEALYEFLEESDVYATLLLVFDSLNDTARRSYVENFIQPEEIYSKSANSNLLTYFIKNKKFDVVDKLVRNTDNLDVVVAFGEVLNKYPDTENKVGNVEVLFKTGFITNESKGVVENYIANSTDSVKTKAKMLVLALGADIKLSVAFVLDNVLAKADAQDAKDVLTHLCKIKMSDEEILRILTFVYECGNFKVAIEVLQALSQSSQYVVLAPKHVITMLSQDDYSAEEKVELLNLSLQFKTEKKAMEAILNNYLCYSPDDVQTRKLILDCLFAHATVFPTTMVETYVWKCPADGERKPEVVKQMFDKGLVTTFFDDLLARYLDTHVDAPDVKEAVVETLIDLGLKIDSASFVNYVCESNDTPQGKIRFIVKMEANGVKLRKDVASIYLERTLPSKFSSELFTTIYSSACVFSARALENYVLNVNERPTHKVKHLQSMLASSPGVAGDVVCRINHLSHGITCNLLQAYLLQTTDSQDLAFEIVDMLHEGQHIKINKEMVVSGSSMKLRKYVVNNRANLSETTNAICEKYKVYSMIF